jgi:cation:H+ antiporter
VLTPLLQFLVCAAAIVVAGTFLSKFADPIAELTGLGRLRIGSVLLAVMPSTPAWVRADEMLARFVPESIIPALRAKLQRRE